MAKKSKQARDRVEEVRKNKELREAQLKAELLAAEQAEKEAIEAEKKHFDETKNKIENIAKEAKFFCGVVLNASEIAEIVKLAITSSESISIPFMLYEKEIEN